MKKNTLEIARQAFEHQNYEKAKQYYELCTTAKANVTDQEKQHAFYMLVYLYLREENYEQSFHYYRALSNPYFKSDQLPRAVKNIPLYKILNSVLPSKAVHITTLDVRACQLKGSAFKSLLRTIVNASHLKSINLSCNPLHENDITEFLDAIVDKQELAFLDLSLLTINRSAAEKIADVIYPLKNKLKHSLEIKMQNCSISDISPIATAVRIIRDREITVDLSGCRSNKTFIAPTTFALQNDKQQLLSLNTKQCDYSKRKSDFFHAMSLVKTHFDSATPILQKLVKQKRIHNDALLIDLSYQNADYNVLLDKDGKILSIIYHHDGNLIIKVTSAKRIDINFSQDDIKTYKAFIIYAPNSTVHLQGNFSVEGSSRIYCKTLIVYKDSRIAGDHFDIHTVEKLLIKGCLQALQFFLDSSHIALEQSGSITCSNTKSEKSQLILKVNTCHFQGGIKSDAVIVDAEDTLLLDASANVQAKLIKLSTFTTIKCSAHIQSDELYIHAYRQLILTPQCHLQITSNYINSAKINLQGKIVATSIEMDGHELIHLEKTSHSNANKIILQGKHIFTLGQIKSQCLSYHGQQIHINGETYLSQQDYKLQSSLIIKAKACTIDAVIYTQRFMLESEQLFFSCRSKLSYPDAIDKEQLKNITNTIKCAAKLYIDTKASVESAANLNIITHEFSLYGELHGSNTINLEVNGCGKIFKDGKLACENGLKIEGDRVWISGDVDVKGPITIALNKFLILGICDFEPGKKFNQGNLLGSLSGQQIAITSAFYLNFLSKISAKASIQINAFLDITLGLSNAKQVSHSTIVYLNLGMNITALKSIQSVFDLMRQIVKATSSQETQALAAIKDYCRSLNAKTVAMNSITYALQLAGIAGKLLIIFMPQIGVPVNIILNCANMLLQLAMNAQVIKNEIFTLIKKKQSGVAIHPRDIYPLLLAGKNLIVTGSNAVLLGLTLPNTLQHIPEQIQTSHENLLSVLPNVAGLAAGSSSTQSALEINAGGLTATGLSSSTSVMNYSLFHTNISGTSFENDIINNQEFCNNLSALRQISANTYVEENGRVLGESQTVTVDQCHLGGQVHLNKFTGHAEHFKQTGDTNINNIIFSSAVASLDGNFHAQNGAFVTDTLTTTQHSDVNLSSMTLMTKEADLAGKMQLCKVNAAITTLKTNLNANVQVSDSNLKVTEGDIRSGHIQIQKSSAEFKQLQEKQDAEFIATESAVKIDQGNLQGEFTLKESYFESSSAVTTTVTAQTHIEKTAIKANQFEIAGKLDTKESAYELENLKTTAAADASFSDSYIKSKEADLKGGHVHLEHVNAEIAQLHEDEHAQLSIHKTTLTTEHADFQDQFLTSESQVLAAANINLAAGSKVEADKSYIKAAEVSQQAGSSLTLTDSYLETNDSVLEGHSELQKSSIQTITLQCQGELQSLESYIKADQVNYGEKSQTVLTQTVIEANGITQDEHATLHTDNVALNAKQVLLQGHTTVDHQLYIDATDKFTLAENGDIKKNLESEVQIKTLTFEKKGAIDLDKLLLDANLSSTAVNELCTEKNLTVDQLTINTSQNVTINQTISAAKDFTLVASGITDNKEQNLHSLTLVSTQDNLVINKKINASDEVTLLSQGKVAINASVSSKEIEAYGKKGVECRSTHKTSVPPENNHHSWRDQYNSRYQQHATKVKHRVESTSPETKIEGKMIILESDANINIKGVKVDAAHLAMRAKGDIYFDESRQTSKQIDTTQITANNVEIKASNLINHGQTVIGDNVIIEVDQMLRNDEAGIMAANHLLYIDAGNIYNQCQVQTVQGEYDSYQTYQSANLIGGDGANSNGVGAYIHTTGVVVNDASNILSTGTNVILADGGLQSLARSNSYISYKKDESSMFGLNQTHEEHRQTIIGSSTISSREGQNIISCEHGGIKAVATNFTATNGTDIYSKDNAEFYDLVAATSVRKNDRTAGIFYSNEKRYDEYAQSSVIQDNKNINIVSDSDIKMCGTVITTPEHLHVEAKNFEESVSKLKHTCESSSFGVSGTVFNKEVFSCHNPVDCSRPISNGDPTFHELQQLANSSGVAETLFNTLNTGSSLFHAASDTVIGVFTGSLIDKALEREAPGLYSTQLGINFTHTETSSCSENSGPGSISAGSADFVVNNTIKIQDTAVQITNDLDVHCTNFILRGEQLHSETDEKMQNLNLTGSAFTNSQVSINASHSHTLATTQQNEQLHVGGTLSVHAENMILDGANVDAGKCAGEVDILTINTYTDDCHTSTTNFTISKNGDFTLGHQQATNHPLHQASELHVTDSINRNSNEFTVHILNSRGGRITSDGVNNFQAHTIYANAAEESHISCNWSVQGNIDDPKFPKCKLKNDNHEINNQTVFSGKHGTHIHANKINGHIEIHHSDAKERQKFAGKFQQTTSNFFKPADKNNENSQEKFEQNSNNNNYR